MPATSRRTIPFSSLIKSYILITFISKAFIQRIKHAMLIGMLIDAIDI